MNIDGLLRAVVARVTGNWEEIAQRYLSGQYLEAVNNRGKYVVCPNKHTTKNKRSLRAKSDFADTGNLFCNCFEGSFLRTVDAILETVNISKEQLIVELATYYRLEDAADFSLPPQLKKLAGTGAFAPDPEAQQRLA